MILYCLIGDRYLASVLKMNRSNKIYKFVSTWTVSISTRQKRQNKGCIKFNGALGSWVDFCNINGLKTIKDWF